MAAQSLTALAQAVHKIKPSPLINLGALQDISGHNVGQRRSHEEKIKKIKIQKNSGFNSLRAQNTFNLFFLFDCSS